MDMTDIEMINPHHENLEGESTDPEYLAWRDAKVQEALDEVEADPNSVIPLWKVIEEFEPTK